MQYVTHILTYATNMYVYIDIDGFKKNIYIYIFCFNLFM